MGQGAKLQYVPDAEQNSTLAGGRSYSLMEVEHTISDGASGQFPNAVRDVKRPRGRAPKRHVSCVRNGFMVSLPTKSAWKPPMINQSIKVDIDKNAQGGIRTRDLWIARVL